MQENILRKINSISFLIWTDEDGRVILNIPLWVIVVITILCVVLVKKARST